MKYLYKILRLFFCPHKYKFLHTLSDKVHTYAYISQCKYCGKIKFKWT